MADYSGAYERTCCNSSVFGDHQPLCTNNLHRKRHVLARKHNMKYDEESHLYFCHNGCGMPVFDPPAHMRFVHERFG
jgi:hypothetical protein